jgi:Zn-dependent protease with chaperone function
MNFFDHQDAARRATRRLVVLFLLSIAGTIALLYAPVGFMLASEQANKPSRPSVEGLPAWLDPAALLVVAAIASGLILLGALVRRVQLSGGGKSVAESLGGRWLDPASASPSERRLLDVVEEMSIASGMPVPPVAVIEDSSINAFAAGTSPANAVLGFTRGAINRLSRDELQGVVAHEFSHVAHGDMRLNIRLACAIAGVMVIALIGRVLLQVAARAPRSRSKKGDATVALLLFGLVLMIAGAVGAFFGRILQAAVSRQREFLADASAAQYTRNPRALADALRTIANSGTNRLDAEAASGLNHFFFTSAADAWLASHPPIQERIRRLEGSEAVMQATMPQSTGPRVETASGFAPAGAPASAVGARPDPKATRNVVPLLSRRIPIKLIEACREPFDAQAVLLLSTWSTDDQIRERQRDVVRSMLGPAIASTVSRLKPSMERVPEALRLMLLDLCMPALQQLSQPQYQSFRTALTEVMRADGRVSLYEWAMRSVLARRVEARFGALQDPHGRAALDSRRNETFVILSTLAWASDRSRATQAFRRAHEWIRWLPNEPMDAARCSLDALDAALERLAHVDERGRHQLVEAVASVVSEDGRLHPRELLLLRGISDRLDVFVPSSIDMLESEAPGAALDA